MNYSDILREAIERADLTLAQISRRLQAYGLKTNKAQLSKLQNGKMPPAGDKLNEALADLLNIDPIEFKAAAYREKIPAEVLEKLQSHPKASSA